MPRHFKNNVYLHSLSLGSTLVVGQFGCNRFRLFYVLVVFNCLIFLNGRTSLEAQQLRPTQSIVDYLNVKRMDTSLEARQKLFVETFGDSERYVGEKEQNIRLLRTLLRNDRNSCSVISSYFEHFDSATVGLIGGFGWGSRALSGPPDIWNFDANTQLGTACQLEQGVFGLLANAAPRSWDEGQKLAKFISKRVKEENSQGPVVLIGHSFGGWGAVRAAEALNGLGIKVDLLVAIDAVNVNSPASEKEMRVPDNVQYVVHIKAADVPSQIRIAGVSRTAIEYAIADTTHTDIDEVQETHDILRHIIAQLPVTGINANPQDYDVSLPTKTNQFPQLMRNTWTRSVTVKKH
jgi:pimeloyl-ACP methyl ester carboxylesterase